MATPVIMPRQGQSVETCLFSAWHVRKGSPVKKGDLLFSYETDKAAFDAEAPADGIVLETFASPGDVVPVLANIAVIGAPGESYKEFLPGSSAEEKMSASVEEDSTEKADDYQQKQTPTYIDVDNERKKISPRARKASAKMKVSLKGIAGSGPEGRILERDILAKAGKSPKSTPLARNIAYSEDIELPAKGSGKGGKVLSSDLKNLKISGSTEEFEEKPLTHVRRLIASKMHESLQNTAQLTLHSSADARKILSLRKEFKMQAERSGATNITLNDLVCFATIRALKIQGFMNAHFMGNSTRFYHVVHLGIAVDTPRGLLVPTLRNADRLSLTDLSLALKDLSGKAQQGAIDPELLSGASFTITNLGALGVEMFTPVLNPPQVGILGVNNITYQPGDLGDGTLGFIPRMGLSLTFDHRAVDGAPAAVFLKEVVSQISEFDTH